MLVFELNMPDTKPNKKERPPVVVIVGHVDHGKTTLLDYIRKENIADREAGGITQSVAAYEIEHSGKKITFIDTPGHEAFTMMRTQGAAVADIAILVVAADDGVKLQTKEAIKILQSTKTPFIVAITKSDTTGADIEKVKGELMAEEVLLEGSGGNISWQTVSGKTGEGVDDLLSLIILTAEVEELTYDPTGRGNGFILEAQKDPGRGIVAHVILKDGVLHQGDDIVTQSVSGKIKMLEDFTGKRTKELVPSAPATVGSFEKLPKNGEEFWAGEVDLKVVKVSGNADTPIAREAAEALEGTQIVSENATQIKAVLKADSVGSLEALRQILSQAVNITEASVGEVSGGDVQFAKSTGSAILGFRVKTNKDAIALAEAHRITIFTSDIIYRIAEKVEELEKTLHEGEATEGKLEVLAVFNSTQSKQTIGGKVVEGVLGLNAPIQISRNDEVVGKGRIKNLQENKSDVKEIHTGTECGVILSTETQIEVGDIISITS